MSDATMYRKNDCSDKRLNNEDRRVKENRQQWERQWWIWWQEERGESGETSDKEGIVKMEE